MDQQRLLQRVHPAHSPPLLPVCLPCPPPLLQAVAEDRWPFSTAIPPLLQYPVSDKAFAFVQSLVWMFYAPSWAGGCRRGCAAAGGRRPGVGEAGKWAGQELRLLA